MASKHAQDKQQDTTVHNFFANKILLKISVRASATADNVIGKLTLASSFYHKVNNMNVKTVSDPSYELLKRTGQSQGGFFEVKVNKKQLKVSNGPITYRDFDANNNMKSLKSLSQIVQQFNDDDFCAQNAGSFMCLVFYGNWVKYLDMSTLDDVASLRSLKYTIDLFKVKEEADKHQHSNFPMVIMFDFDSRAIIFKYKLTFSDTKDSQKEEKKFYGSNVVSDFTGEKFVFRMKFEGKKLKARVIKAVTPRFE